jgi:F0F1-type ATP synthase membrane subunit c/vacuolar-type H+-ATPase subunit K
MNPLVAAASVIAAISVGLAAIGPGMGQELLLVTRYC